MALQIARAGEALRLAQNFRLGAAEAGDTVYNPMMMRVAVELEQLAETILHNRGNTLTVIEGGAS